DHTVHEGELIGLTLAAQLLATERNIVYPASILVDNQAVIQTGEVMNKTGSGFIADNFEQMTRRLAKRHEAQGDFRLTVRWIPGHVNVAGNELADQAAKEAAQSEDNNSPTRLLPKYL
ncbi:hypothetical protein DEU56DRAFT_713922, partial [Suillus clintonianus]|uniref:uncharacterized protein n=1 Tax=Suillus clintonianus TaxID=1904413 RepID=UPI001B884851